MEGFVVGARPAVRLAVVGAMRRPPVPPFAENHASIPRGRIRGWT